MKPFLNLALCLVLGPMTLSAQEAAENARAAAPGTAGDQGTPTAPAANG